MWLCDKGFYVKGDLSGALSIAQQSIDELPNCALLSDYLPGPRYRCCMHARVLRSQCLTNACPCPPVLAWYGDLPSLGSMQICKDSPEMFCALAQRIRAVTHGHSGGRPKRHGCGDAASQVPNFGKSCEVMLRSLACAGCCTSAAILCCRYQDACPAVNFWGLAADAAEDPMKVSPGRALGPGKLTNLCALHGVTLTGIRKDGCSGKLHR